MPGEKVLKVKRLSLYEAARMDVHRLWKLLVSFAPLRTMVKVESGLDV